MSENGNGNGHEPALPRLLTLRGASEHYGLKLATIRRLVQSGFIPVVKVSEGETATWYVDRVDVDRWLEKAKRVLDL